MKKRSLKQHLFAGVFLLLLTSIGCINKNCVQIPKDGTKVTTTSTIYKEFAAGLDQNDCKSLGGCTCYLDGLNVPCNIVFACLESGLCERVKL